MLTFVEKYRDNGKYSQNGEWGILLECLNRIKPTIKTSVEFGCPDFTYCSNTAQLEELGWFCSMYDINPNPDPRIINMKITPENVNSEIGNPTVLSIDVDNDDYHIWKAYKGQPDIVIIEINSSVPPHVPMIPGTRGASYQSMTELGISKGYFLLAHTGNFIFVADRFRPLFPEVYGDPLTEYFLYFNDSFL